MSKYRSVKPTTYNGIDFRSRLEARWAAMFNFLRWDWEYEPEVSGNYIPDFLLHGFGDTPRNVFVEVKPEAIYRANREEIVSKARSAIGADVDLLVVHEKIYKGEFGDATIGFMPPSLSDHDHLDGAWDLHGDDEHARLIRITELDDDAPPFDFCHTWGSWVGRLSGFYNGNAAFEPQSFQGGLWIWSWVGNRIQWKPELAP